MTVGLREHSLPHLRNLCTVQPESFRKLPARQRVACRDGGPQRSLRSLGGIVRNPRCGGWLGASRLCRGLPRTRAISNS